MRKILITFSLLLITCCLTAQEHIRDIRVGKGGNIVFMTDNGIRAISGFRGTAEGGAHYAEAINEYKAALPNVRVYSMIIPIASQYYCPPEKRDMMSDQREVINGMYSQMHDVTTVDVASALERHIGEKIYSRTDHHWLPLGAYYAAQAFAQAAGVPFRTLDSYDEHVVHGFVGTMGKFSGDARVKTSPEDFVFYTPKDSTYTTEYINHLPTKQKGIYTLSKPFDGPFFLTYKDGSSLAYCTFMGGDARTTHVKAMGNNGRRLLIIKDSFGNALPGYLFYSFDDIYVVDFRYFQRNILAYIREKGITDLLFANNMQHAYTKGTSAAFVRMLKK